MAVLRKKIRNSYLFLSKLQWINKLYWHYIKPISEEKYQELRPELFQVGFPAIKTVWSLTFATQLQNLFLKTVSSHTVNLFSASILQSLIFQLQMHTELLYVSYLMNCQAFSFIYWFSLCLWHFFYCFITDGSHPYLSKTDLQMQLLKR